jgi:hypothetical protein
MRTPIKWAVGLFLWVVGSTASVAAPISPDAVLPGRLLEGCESVRSGVSTCTLLEADRRVVESGIAEYSYTLRVGSGAQDLITVHRVVAELFPGRALPAHQSVFLVHGDLWGFRSAFLPGVTSSAVPREKSFAIHLARQGMEVWGIDLRWVHVPANTTDFTFMKDWNLEMHVQDVSTGLLLARTVRAVGPARAGPMPLLGWSRGATIGYALLNAETQWSPDRRQVSAFIPVDMAYVFGADATSQRASACQGYQTLSTLHAAGMYVDGSGQTLHALGFSAINAPALPSPLLPGLTNRQAALLAGTATYLLQGNPVFGWYHFTGGVFAGSLPTATTWTHERFLFETMEQASPLQSVGEQVETLAMWCGSPTLPYTQWLGQVKVPVLYVGAAGGVGRFGLATLSRLGGKDVTSYVVQRLADSDRALDYGHADLFLAADADTTVWSRIVDWLERH